MLKNKTKKKSILFILLFLNLFTFLYIPKSLFSITPSFPSSTDNLYEGHTYNFTTQYYDDTNYTAIFNNANLETQFTESFDGTPHENHSATIIDNFEYYYPNNITVNEGSYEDEGTLDSLDDNATSFYSSDQESLTPEYSNFIMNNGNIIKNGTNYLGNYTFINDIIDNVPTDWIDVSTGDGYVKTKEWGIGTSYLHYKVISIAGGVLSGVGQTYLAMLDHSYGSIEFWYQYTHVGNNAGILFRNGGTNLFGIRNDGSNLQYYDGSYHTITTFSDDVWYHFRISFECTTGNYDGLSQWYWKLYLNDIEYGDYAFASNNILNRMYCYSNQAFNVLSLDSIDFSWNDGYYIGRNKINIIDGLNSIDNNKMILDGTTFETSSPNSDDFQYNDNWYQNGTNFIGEYSFTDDTVGGDPTGWTITGETGSSYVDVDAMEVNHRKVVDIYDGTTTDVPYMTINPSNIEYGTVEYFAKGSDVTNWNGNLFWNSGSYLFRYMFYADQIRVDHGGGSTYITAIKNDVWYHIKVEFECTTGGYKGLGQYEFMIYIDGRKYDNAGSNWAFSTNVPYLDKFEFSGTSGAGGHHYYLDSIDFSWDTGYYDGRSKDSELCDLTTEVSDDYIVAETTTFPYNASYNFDDDYIGETGTSIGYVDSLSGTSSYITIQDSTEEVYGNALRCYDTSGSGGADITHNLNTGMTSGTIEFWCQLATYGGGDHWFQLRDSTSRAVWLVWDSTSSGIIYYFDGVSQLTLVSGIYDTWLHFRIVFDCSTQTYDIYLDGVLEVDDADFVDSCTELDNSWHTTGYGGTGLIYFDAFDESTDPAYYLNRNWESPAEINFTAIFNIDGIPNLLTYNISTGFQPFNISIWNFDNLEWDIYEENVSYTSFSENSFSNFNTSYYNSSNYIKINFYSYNFTNDFYLYINELYLTSYAKLNFTVSLDASSFTDINNINLFYSYRTTTSDYINMSIYNYDDSEYNLVLSSDSSSFTNYMYQLNSSYFSGSNIVLLLFDVLDTSSTIEMELEKLLVLEKTYINVSAIIDLEDITDLLEYQVCSFYNSSDSSVYINYSVFCFYNSSWIDISYLLSDTDYLNSTYFVNGTNIEKFLNETEIMVNFFLENYEDKFYFYIDLIQSKNYYPLELNVGVSFDLLGVWRYRWNIDSYSSDWYYFDVIPPQSNIEMISESNKLTEWEFIESGYEEIELYQSNFTTETWNLTTLDNDYDIIYNNYVSDDAYVQDYYIYTNYGSENYVLIGYEYLDPYNNWDYLGYFGFDNSPYNLNTLQSSNLTFYASYVLNPYTLDIYNTTIFDEDTLTWSNKPSIDSYLISQTISGVGMYIYTLEDFDFYNYLAIDINGTTRSGYIRSKEYGYPMYYIFNMSKYLQEDTFFLTQTDEEETLSIKSPNNLSLSLIEGDKLRISYNTTSENLISINLLNSGITQSSYILSEQGNLNNGDQIKTITITDNCTIDQIEITGIFEEENSFYLNNLEIFQINSTSDILTYSLEPYGDYDIYIDFPSDWTINVYEDTLLVETFNISTTQNIQSLVYERINTQTNYIFLYDSNEEYLNYNDFTLYVNYTYQGYNVLNKRLSGNQFTCDIDTMFDYKIYDSFNSLIERASDIGIETFIDIILNIYELKIKNEASKFVNYSLNNDNTDIEKNGILLPGETVYFYLNENNYTLNYFNNEDDSNNLYEFNLNTNQIVVINTTYYTVWFSITTNDGLGVDRDLLRFYINSERRELGPNVMQEETNNLKVLDYFNATLFDQDIDTSSYAEYIILISLYTLILNNNFTEEVKINIQRPGIDIVYEVILDASNHLSFRFLGNVEYEISVYSVATEDLLYHDNFELDEEFKTISFGFFETEIPVDPTPIALSFMTYLIFIILFVVVSMTFLYLYMRRTRNNQYKIPPKRKESDNAKFGLPF